MPIISTEPKRLCHLSDGTIARYDACSADPNAYDSTRWTFIGTGTIYSINGKRSAGSEQLYFFVRCALRAN